jgi:type IV pilus assembly protein PilM
MIRSFLNASFPTPKFLAMPAVGLDISDQSVKFAEIISHSDGLRLGRSGMEKIPEGAISSGKIIENDIVRGVLSKIKKDYGFKFVRVALPEEQIYLFELVVPKATGAEVHDAIELSLEEYVPIPPLEAVFDYDLVSQSSDGMLTMKVAVTSKSLIESYTSIFKEAGLAPVSFELEASAAARAIIKKDDKGTYLVLDLGENRTGISIVSESYVRFASSLDVGGSTLTSMIERGMKITATEAEAIKKERGLAHTPENQEIFSLLLSPISILRDEINKHYIYWHTHPGPDGKERPKIEKIILCGGDANLIGLSDYLTTSMRIPVELGDAWINVTSFDNYIPEISAEKSLSFTTAIGLSLLDFYI